MYKQMRAFNINKAGTQKYWCLQNVRLGYSIPARHQFAYEDWQKNIQHKDRKYPTGCAVPVYWSFWATLSGEYRNWGHIAVRLANGKIWTDGRYYNSVDEVTKNYLSNGSYLGWGELVNNVRVVQPQEVSTVATINDDVSRQIGFHYLGRNGKDGRKNALQSKQTDIFGKPLTNEQISAFFLSAESRKWRDELLPALYAERDVLRENAKNHQIIVERLEKAVADRDSQIDDLNATVLQQEVKINELTADNALLEEEVKALKKQLEGCDSTGEPKKCLIDVIIDWFKRSK